MFVNCNDSILLYLTTHSTAMNTLHRRITAFLLLLLILQSCMIRSMVVISKAEFSENSSKEVTIAYTDSAGLMVIPIVIEGKTYRFIFDTGAQTTVISTELSQLTSFKKKGGIKVKDAHQHTTKLVVGALSEIDLAGMKYRNVGVIVNDFSQNEQFRCIGIDGILGMNALALNNWRIDYEKMTITSYDQEKALEIPNGARNFAFVTKSGIPYIEWMLNDKNEKFMVDTGKNSEIISVGTSTKIDGNSSASIGQGSFGMFGKTLPDTTRYFKVNFSDTSGFDLANVSVSQTPAAASNIGNGFFRKNYQVVYFDFKHRKMYCSHARNALNGYQTYGLSSMIVNGQLVVASKDVGFTTEIEAVSLQDTILAVNGIRLNGNNVCDLIYEVQKSKLRREAITVVLKRKSEEIELLLPLREIHPSN